MLSLLLDENISPQVASQILRLRPDISVVSVQVWRDGSFMSKGDELLLDAAARDGLTLVTYDLKTITPILTRWALGKKDHGGIVFVHSRTISSDNFGALVGRLIALWDRDRQLDWTNTLKYLSRA